MNEDFVALADLVGQLLAARWIEDHELDEQQDDPHKDLPPRSASLSAAGHDQERVD